MALAALLEIIKVDMKVEVWFTPHCIDNLVSYTLITNETNFNINKVKKNATMLPPPLNFEEREKNKVNCLKNYFEKTNRATGLKSWSFMPITIPHNRLDLWYDSIQTFFQNNFFNNQFWSFQAQFRTYLPCTSQWGKFSSSRLCIFDFRNEIHTKFQSRKHVLFYILAIFIFPPFWQSNTTRVSNLVIGWPWNCMNGFTKNCSGR